MPVEFQQFPANWRQPLYYVEVDPSQAGIPVSNPIALVVGHYNQTVPPDPSAPVNPKPMDVPIVIGSLADATQYFGPGSMLEAAFRAFFLNNFGTLVFALPIAQPTAGVAAKGTITVTSPPTQQGIYNLYVAGQLVPVGVLQTDTIDTAAGAIEDAINSMTSLPVTAVAGAAGTGLVTLTCKWTGLTGNDIDMRDSYLGKYGGQVMPIGMAVTYANPNPSGIGGKLAGGVGNPNFSNGIANLGDQEYEYVSMPFWDTGSYQTWDAEYGFTDNGRWGWARQQYGTVFSAYRDTYANLVIWGENNNSAVISVMAMEPDIPSPSWEVAAAYTSKGARSYMNDPARPLQTLELNGVLPAPKHKRFLLSQNNNLSYSGLATQRVDANNLLMIARESMMYQKNVYGIPDDAYELGTTLHTLAKLFRNQRYSITTKYPRHKLADDGTRYGVGQAIVTPSVIRAELVAEYAVDEYNGLVENLNAYKQNLVVERDPNDPNRVNVIYPPDLVNQMRIFAVLAQFRLQYNRGVDTVIAAG
jgi:phage tail sheath gpL-like